MYYQTNLIGSMNIMQCMVDFKVTNVIFSSSATVYGNPHRLPITEDHPVGQCTNAYGKSKFFIEEFLTDHCAANPVSPPALLPYFSKPKVK